MLGRKLNNIFVKDPIYRHVNYGPIVHKRDYSKWFDILSANMASTVRFKVIRDIFLNKIFSLRSRSYFTSSMFRRYRGERGVKEMFLYFRQVMFRPRAQLMVTVTAAFKKGTTEEKSGPPKRCSRNIRDADMVKLIDDLKDMEELSKATLYCEGCDKRIVLDSKETTDLHCKCPNSKPPKSDYDGWVPYMEAQDIIIWRKEYKPGGLFAYKVYGRYKHIKAENFAMIQVDGAYRRAWDDSVASLSVVEYEANGKEDQCVLHWEVLWPRLFSNRDYVYIRRHKEFDIKTECLVHKDGLFPDVNRCTQTVSADKAIVHDHAKKMSLQNEAKELNNIPLQNEPKEPNNKVYVIVSRSCTHPDVPETRKAIRVLEYWSHMVITTLHGPDEPGMEFVLTYYDEPAVGGLPVAVTSWAMGRAGPAFLARMRKAAEDYDEWRKKHAQTKPDFPPFSPVRVSYDIDDKKDSLSEQDMEMSKYGPDLNEESNDKSTQTIPVNVEPMGDGPDQPEDGPQALAMIATLAEAVKEELIMEAIRMNPEMDETTSNIESETDLIQEHEIDKDEVEATDSIIIEPCEQSHTETVPKPVYQELKAVEITKEIDDNIQLTIEATLDIKGFAKEAESDGDSSPSANDKDNAIEEKSVPWWRYLYPLYYFV